mmetsp:Transcript_27619/g.47684  ORF Transcript_27619/g.47684 Transcript_27619/m.47684 type:complete len:373 (+) Transcript_27619:73-1191(+)|eukprot:CAMPEP_0196663768 /NCGR_PEP_ID=MMETSP1086-20130531/54128_1 /TAXON_ID=77921 /ORGANISM="Cyanoptyche  gloeocystis , Strain SAG4.97" /LENGTH=372 /DNA_ID=CAMNT_0041999711 /DNA_START=72 /DNA_END=1190 /DNA_ORIENTATION=+
MKADSILGVVGNTPHVKLSNIFRDQPDKDVWIKLERCNPGGSIKDRIALAMIEDAEQKGILKPGISEIAEPTSGNQGIGLAIACALKGYPLTLVIPSHYSEERRRIMASYGAKVEVIPIERGFDAALFRVMHIAKERPQTWIPNQFTNPSAVRIHEEVTAAEILRDFPDGFDYLITGVGSGSHITGVAKALKEKFPKLKVYAVEPATSDVITATMEGRPIEHLQHKIQGIAAGFVPPNCDVKLLDGVVHVSNEEAFEYARRAPREEGLFCGMSTGASLAAVAKMLPKMEPGARVLTFNYDLGDRYLSVPDLFVGGDISFVEVDSPLTAFPERLLLPSQVANKARLANVPPYVEPLPAQPAAPAEAPAPAILG